MGLVRLGSGGSGLWVSISTAILNLAFWLASLAIVIAAICFMLTKIELTDADVARSESLKVSHALELAKNGQFWMLLLFTLFVTQIYDTYD